MNRSINLLFSLTLLLKLGVALAVPLTTDEYYYYLWGQHLSLSYFDHPPLVGWIMNLSQDFIKFGEGAIRWPFIIISQITIYVWYLIMKSELNKTYLFWFLVTALFNPLWGLGGYISTPDIPLLLFWSLSLLFTKRIMESESWPNYLGLGFCLGCGFLAKYQIVLFLPSLIWLLIQHRLFKRLLTAKTFVAILFALLVCSPVFIWNVQNDWASFNFQWQHGMSAGHCSWKYPFDYIFSQILLVFPTFLFFLANRNKDWWRHWLTPFAFFPLLFFLFSSFKSRVEGNWAIMAFPAIYALAYQFTTQRNFMWMRRTNLLWISVFVIILFLLPFKNLIPHKGIKLFESEKYENILTYLKEGDVYLTYNYQLSSYLSFKKNKLICKYPYNLRTDHFNYLEECKTPPKQFNLIVEENGFINIKKLFPNYRIESKESIDSQFVNIKLSPL